MNDTTANTRTRIFFARARSAFSPLIAFPIFFLILLFVFSLESARAEPLVSILLTGNSLGLYKACPT